ncbi:MAG: penicillin-binding transpeptidase domain-containing protein, partial [Oligoflexia bacterium]|nr:penicillin-binding transpeptidase domain-containing protein [Oligoflexia bacterium]
MFKGQIINQRIYFVLSSFTMLWLVLFAKSAWLQLLPNSRLSNLQNKLFERTVTLKPRRGNIYDRYNRELAVTIPSQSLFADPQRMNEPYYVAKKLSELFGKPRKFFLRKFLDKKRRFVWVKRHLSKRELEVLKSWNLEGLYFLKENKRFYTNETSLSQVLGFTGIEGQGLEGIEKQYEKVLSGESQKVLIQRDARGRPLFMDFSPFISKVSGYDVHLTIDSDLQFYLEKGLKEAVKNSQADSAIGLILSAETSEVLAMANLPNYNSNQVMQSPVWMRRNRAVTDIFEPGSTLKTFTVISA